MKHVQAGFSLVELMVVVGIISILSSVLYFNMSQGSAQARDVERRADLREMQSALELYKNQYGRYPARCANSQPWSGEAGTIYACTSGDEYIVGLAPEFMPRLPKDPRRTASDSGYVYTVNAAGSVYKLMAKKTVESEVVTINHEFASCATSNRGAVACDPPVPGRTCDYELCDRLLRTDNSLLQTNPQPNECGASNSQFQTSYAVWGGFAEPSSSYLPGTEQYAANQEFRTEAIWCQV